MFGRSLITSDTQLNRQSYYEASVERPPVRPALQCGLSVDAVVIGGGFAGLSAALELAQRGMEVVLLEADRVGSGASGRNGGQAIVGYASGQEPFEEQLGEGDARLAWDLSIEALDLIHRRREQHAIDCDWVSGYLHVADHARKAKGVLEEARWMERMGIACEVAEGASVRELINTNRYVAAARESRSGHLHPLKYALGLQRAAEAAGVKVFEQSAVTALERGETIVVRTRSGEVRARFGVLAGNCLLPEYGPAVAPDLAARIMPVGTYIIGTESLNPTICADLIKDNAAVCDNNFVLDYFRFSSDHRMLFGGRVSYTTMTPPRLKEIMQQRMGRIFPALANVDVPYVWGGFVDISMNRAPDFGRLGSNLYYLQGFSGHGVALTGLAGQLVAEALAGQAERFDLFARLKHRPFPGGKWLRTPSLALGMLWYRLKDLTG